MSDLEHLQILGRCIVNMPPALRATDPSPGIKAMREALENIARQNLTREMIQEQHDGSDFEGAYDKMIEVAREAVAFTAR